MVALTLIRSAFSACSNRGLFALVVGGDLAVLAITAPLERYALRAAADPSSSAMLIGILLAANILLPWRARTASTFRRARVIRGEVKQTALKGRV